MYISNLLTLILISVVFGAVLQPIHAQSVGNKTDFTSFLESTSSASGDTIVPIVRLSGPELVQRGGYW